MYRQKNLQALGLGKRPKHTFQCIDLCTKCINETSDVKSKQKQVDTILGDYMYESTAKCELPVREKNVVSDLEAVVEGDVTADVINEAVENLKSDLIEQLKDHRASFIKSERYRKMVKL